MAQDRVFNVLLAEDEQFQRLALLDILTLCDYEVTVTENGKAAYEELKDENKDFDLVLLDLYMPKLDGFELLSLMQEDERLRTIPVVVMTANDTNDIAANCLKMGAVNFLVKPIRIQECKALVKHMKQTQISTDKIEKGLFKYENIRPLGKGAAGSVNLVRNKLDCKEYALKTINLTYLNDKDKKSAENEIQFLRVLQGPTLIKFVESFIENNCIYIVMEYADGGSLDQKIRLYQNRGQKFETEEILRYMAQITLGVMAMHSKNILHRDIKTQNIFITQNDILKMGDFGISRQMETLTPMQMTACGTPYFMPPEVCMGKPYDSKADVWAIGVILYELITFRKPFDSDSINGVFEKIKKAPIDPLPQSVDSSLQLLVSSLLNKDYNNRPNIFDISKIPCIKRHIIKFVDEYNLRDEVMAIFDIDNYRKEDLKSTSQINLDEGIQGQTDGIFSRQSTTNGVTPQAQKPHNQTLNGQSLLQQYPMSETVQLQSYQLEQLGDWAELIRNDVKIQEYKNGWFGRQIRCVYGGDIYRWIKEHVEANEKKAQYICQKMLEKGIVISIEQKLEFTNVDLFQMHMDRDDIADNMLRRWKDSVRGALEVAANLVPLIEQVYEMSIIQYEEEEHEEPQDEMGGGEMRQDNDEQPDSLINADAAFKSTQYKAYLNAVCELERVTLHELTIRERIAFFLNVYQCMYIHYYLKMTNEEKQHGNQKSQSYFNQLKSYVLNSSHKPFFYCIAGQNFTLDEIKHGVLRGNKKSPHAYLQRALSSGDPKTQLVKDLNDGRINFVCSDFPDVIEHTDTFASEDDLNERLDQFVAEILNAKVNIDTIQGEITLPKVLTTYKYDFCNGTDEGILRFVFKYYNCSQQTDSDEETIIREVCQKRTMIIRYE